MQMMHLASVVPQEDARAVVSFLQPSFLTGRPSAEDSRVHYLVLYVYIHAWYDPDRD